MKVEAGSVVSDHRIKPLPAAAAPVASKPPRDYRPILNRTGFNRTRLEAGGLFGDAKQMFFATNE